MKNFIIQLEEDVYKAPWSGDPGRTLNINNAKVYKSLTSATLSLARARKYRPFINAKIVDISVKE